METYSIKITEEQRKVLARACNSYVNTNAGTNNVPKTVLTTAEDLGSLLNGNLNTTELNNLTGIQDDEIIEEWRRIWLEKVGTVKGY